MFFFYGHSLYQPKYVRLIPNRKKDQRMGGGEGKLFKAAADLDMRQKSISERKKLLKIQFSIKILRAWLHVYFRYTYL